MIRCDSEADSIVWMEEDETRDRKYPGVGDLLWIAMAIQSFVLNSCGSQFFALNHGVPGFFIGGGLMQDEVYMQEALQLAEKGCGWVAPNPMVGAVIVKDGRVIGRGWHERYGQPHAERNALANCSASPYGATMYVTLEPCCHYGKQPPCVEAIIAAGLRRVVVGAPDPNPLVAGKGIRQLRAAGVEVVEDVLRTACERQNEVFLYYMQTRRPFVVMKYAMTLDGKIAAYTGASRWISGEAARRHVQQQRHRYTAIMVGVGTVLADDPLLTCRIPGGRNPLRIICDSRLRTPPTAQVVKTAAATPTILATCCSATATWAVYQAAGCRVLLLPQREGRLDLQQLMEKLGQEQVDSILLEGGGTLNWSALESGIVCKLQAYIAPKLFGGATAKTPLAGHGVASPQEAFCLQDCMLTKLGEDFLVEGRVRQHVYRDC